MKVDPTDRDRIWVTLSGYRAGTGDGHVLMTENNGRTWQDVTGRLPNAPVNDVVIGPDGFVFVATDVGVFRGTPAGRTWVRVGTGLPLAPMTSSTTQPPARVGRPPMDSRLSGEKRLAQWPTG